MVAALVKEEEGMRLMMSFCPVASMGMDMVADYRV